MKMLKTTGSTGTKGFKLFREKQPSRLSLPGPVRLRNHNHLSKYYPFFEEVELVEANPG